MRRWFRLCVLALPLASFAPTAGRGDDQSGSFLNGKDLSGWEGLSQYWSWDLRQNALVGSTKPDGLKFNTFLFLLCL